MTTREEFEALVRRVGNAAVSVHDGDADFGVERHATMAVMRAWDAQAAEVERLRAEVEALRAFAGPHSGPPCRISISSDGETGVPLTAENAPRARVVETQDWPGIWVESLKNQGYWERPMISVPVTTKTLIARGATVLAWRK